MDKGNTEWLSTRNKRKISPKQKVRRTKTFVSKSSRPKSSRPKSSRPKSPFQLTQAFSPPLQLFQAKKQTVLSDWFRTIPAQANLGINVECSYSENASVIGSNKSTQSFSKNTDKRHRVIDEYFEYDEIHSRDDACKTVLNDKSNSIVKEHVHRCSQNNCKCTIGKNEYRLSATVLCNVEESCTNGIEVKENKLGFNKETSSNINESQINTYQYQQENTTCNIRHLSLPCLLEDSKVLDWLDESQGTRCGQPAFVSKRNVLQESECLSSKNVCHNNTFEVKSLSCSENAHDEVQLKHSNILTDNKEGLLFNEIAECFFDKQSLDFTSQFMNFNKTSISNTHSLDFDSQFTGVDDDACFSEIKSLDLASQLTFSSQCKSFDNEESLDLKIVASGSQLMPSLPDNWKNYSLQLP